MAKRVKMTKQGLWEKWVSSRPPVIQDLCLRYPPDRLYLLKPNDQLVTLVSYSEDGTVTVYVSSEVNEVIFDRTVFGVDPLNLVECDVPEQFVLAPAKDR
jgi:hypothetical protein